MSKSKREQGSRCPRMPGEVFTSESDANESRVTRQINVAQGGMVQVTYVVKICQCGRFHVMTDEHFRRWDTARRQAQRERRRNA